MGSCRPPFKQRINAMDNRAIGIFDSGLGGLTCVAEMKRAAPAEDIIYFGDTARVPYGTRSRETILEYAAQDIAFAASKDVKVIIAACGTVSSALGDTIPDNGIPFFGVVHPAAHAAARATRNGMIGITGTPATIRSGAYERAIARISPDIRCIPTACPLFVPMVENGITDPDDVVVQSMVERYLEGIRSSGADTLILGCTHYPHLNEAIQRYMGDDVTLISSGAAAAMAAIEHLKANDGLAGRECGTVRCFTTDTPDMFRENAHRFIGGVDLTVEKVSVDTLSDLTRGRT